MNDLQAVTNQTPIEIALGIDEKGMTTARKLYEFLELAPNNYSRWCKVNILENEFAEEGTDFYSSQRKSEGRGNFAEDYKLSSKFAKKLSMTAKNERGEQARDYFIKAEDKLKQIASKPMSALDQISLIQRATLEVNEKVDEVDRDLQALKNDMPLMAVDTDRITTAKNIKAVKLLGGKQSNAYKDKSVRTKVYRDMEAQIWRQFGVRTYKAIKRNQCDLAVDIINRYELPLILEEEIADCNAQMCMK